MERVYLGRRHCELTRFRGSGSYFQLWVAQMHLFRSNLHVNDTRTVWGMTGPRSSTWLTELWRYGSSYETGRTKGIVEATRYPIRCRSFAASQSARIQVECMEIASTRRGRRGSKQGSLPHSSLNSPSWNRHSLLFSSFPLFCYCHFNCLCRK